MFRLHLDFTIGPNEEVAKLVSQEILNVIKNAPWHNNDWGEEIPKIRYKLCKDGDRTDRNFLLNLENGHVGKKKLDLTL